MTGFAPHTDQGATVHTRHNGTIVTPTLIITAGAWTQRLAGLAGIELPVVPVRRQACYVTLPKLPANKLPMILDRQHDISFRHDTETLDHVLMSRTIRNEPVGFNFDWDAAAFDAVLAPRLRHYLPSCGEPQLQRGWAGHYAVTPDENPILGQHPEYARLFMAARRLMHIDLYTGREQKVSARILSHLNPLPKGDMTMDLDLETFLIALYVMVDDFYQSHIRPQMPASGGPLAHISDSEVLCLRSAAQWRSGVPWKSQHGVLRYVRKHLRHLFPPLLSHSAFNRRLRRLWGACILLQDAVAETLATGHEFAVMDGFPIPVAHGARSFHPGWLAEIARIGTGGTDRYFLWGADDAGDQPKRGRDGLGAGRGQRPGALGGRAALQYACGAATVAKPA